MALVGLFVLAAGLSLFLLAFMLPHEPVVRASFATRTGFDAHVKTFVFHFVVLLVLYVLIPWHAIAGLERELLENRARNLLALPRQAPDAFQPPGIWYVRPAVLGWVMLAYVPMSVVANNYLLDRLMPGPYVSAFTLALHTRTVLWFGLAGLCLAWYSREIQRLKQLATLMCRLDDQQ